MVLLIADYSVTYSLMQSMQLLQFLLTSMVTSRLQGLKASYELSTRELHRLVMPYDTFNIAIHRFYASISQKIDLKRVSRDREALRALYVAEKALWNYIYSMNQINLGKNIKSQQDCADMVGDTLCVFNALVTKFSSLFFEEFWQRE